MELKIPPPLLALFLGYLMWSFAKQVSYGAVEFEYLNALSLVTLFIGLSIELAAIIPFRLAKTTVNPMKPNTASRIISSGIYSYSRNPMYLGTLTLLLALTFWLGNVFNILFLIVFIGYITKFQIKPEERILEELFAEEYILYRKKVRRWL